MKVFVILLSCFLICGSYPVMAAETGSRIGVIKNLKGEASIERNKMSIPAKAGDKLFEKDIVVTGLDGSMGIVLQDNSALSLGPRTKLVLSKYVFVPAQKKLSMVVRVTRGTMTYLTGLMGKMKPEAVRFETPTASCGIRGTHFAIEVKDTGE